MSTQLVLCATKIILGSHKLIHIAFKENICIQSQLHTPVAFYFCFIFDSSLGSSNVIYRAATVVQTSQSKNQIRINYQLSDLSNLYDRVFIVFSILLHHYVFSAGHRCDLDALSCGGNDCAV